MRRVTQAQALTPSRLDDCVIHGRSASCGCPAYLVVLGCMDREMETALSAEAALTPGKDKALIRTLETMRKQLVAEYAGR